MPVNRGKGLRPQSYSQFPQSFPHRYVNAPFCINHNFTRPQSILCGKRPNGGAWMNSSICHSKASARTVHRRKWRTVAEKEQTFVSFEKCRKTFLTKLIRVCYLKKVSESGARMKGSEETALRAAPKGNAKALRQKDRTRTALRKARFSARRRGNLSAAAGSGGETLRS